MTLADAIGCAHAGEMEGFIFLFHHTAPTVWLTATVLGCAHVGAAMTQIYQKALASVSSLRSPSDLRVWLGKIVYGVLLEQPEHEGIQLPVLEGEIQEAYHVIGALPRRERTALLLLCAEGCSAPQAADILSCPDIEVKRALRRARQAIAAHMKQAGFTHACNTAWIISVFSQMRAACDVAANPLIERVLQCVQSDTAFEESPDMHPTTVEQEEKGGFFQKLFRSKRFG